MRRFSGTTAAALSLVLAGVFLGVVRSDVVRSDAGGRDGAPRSAGSAPADAVPVPGGGEETSTGSASAPPPTTAPPLPAPPPPGLSDAEQRLAALTLEQRVGQLFMAGAKADGSDSTAVSALLGAHIGNIYLAGRSKAGIVATAGIVAGLKASAPSAAGGGLPMFVATDQEGGFVQVLGGPGFSVIPTALQQAGQDPDQLRASAGVWGRELLQAGVNVDLGPVLDTVPSPETAASNAPIGYFQRQYGFTPEAVSSHGNAMASGLRDAGVAPVVKHYPGLGRVTLNTDVSGNVHDTATTRSDPYLEPFHAAIKAGVRWVMVSSAYYDKIDPSRLAAFSPVVMRTMLRGDAGFTGIIASDDLCNAAQLAPWAAGERATNFLGAGGTMILCADTRAVPSMYRQVLQRAQEDPEFRKTVDAAALTILDVKAGK